MAEHKSPAECRRAAHVAELVALVKDDWGTFWRSLPPREACVDGRCVCRFNPDGSVREECEPHAALRARAEKAERELSAVRELWQRESAGFERTTVVLTEQRLRAEARAARYREALTFYADRSRWVLPHPMALSDAAEDRGERARSALDGATGGES